MKTKLFGVLCAAAMMVGATAAKASYTVIADLPGSGNNGEELSASAEFTVNGSNLEIILTNTGSYDVNDPSDILTGVLFTLTDDPTLTPVSATLYGGSTVLFGSDGGGNVGGEWAYANGLAGAPHGADEGISSSGLGLFGDANFGGSNLQGPTSVDGLQYGITSAGDNSATGNAAVTGDNALIKNSVKFVLSGLPDGWTADAAHISNVNFQYGTALDEPNIPEPTSVALTVVGLGLFSLIRRKRR